MGTFKKIFLHFFIGIFFSSAAAQLPNSCGLTASIYPATADSVVPFNTTITLTSTSNNTTSVEWLLNGFSTGITTTVLNYGIITGVYNFSLVAKNGNCYDTTTVVYFCAGEPHNTDSISLSYYGHYRYNDYASSIDNTLDSGFIIGGKNSIWDPCGGKGIIVKVKDKGCIEWSKFISNTIPAYCNYTEVKELYAAQDSSIYAIVDNFGSQILKLNKNGDFLWVKQLPLFMGGYNVPLGITNLTGSPDGAVFVTTGASEQGFIIHKLSAWGNILWSKNYAFGDYHPDSILNNDYTRPAGLVWLNNSLYATGLNIVNTGGIATHYYNFVLKIDANSGNTQWQYGYSDDADGINLTRMQFVKPALYKNMLLAGGQAQGQWATIIDQQGNVRKCIQARFDSSYGPYFTKAEADADGNIYTIQWTQKTFSLQPGYANYNNLAKFDTSLNKYWGLTYSTIPGGGHFNDAALGANHDFASVGEFYGKVDDPQSGSIDFTMLKVDTPVINNTGNCNYNVDYVLSLHNLNRLNFTWSKDSFVNILPVDFTNFAISDAYIQSRFACPDFMDSCSFMRITGPKKLCSLASTYTYKLHRNKKCALLPQWKLPQGVNIISQTDSSITVQFSNFGTYKIVATLQSCIPVKDSLTVIIASKNPYPIKLGSDTSICANTTIQLHAGFGYINYLWSNGDTDSVTTINQPGLYWVEVSDSCNNKFRDTILISPFNNAIDIGADRVKCNSDTVQLQGPAGFISYKWSNNYNISSTTTQNVVVNPLMDTAYYLRAEKLPGCFAYDTVKVKVNTSPLITLGADKNICTGDSTAFDAGPGFNQYTWSNGQTSQKITVHVKGIYSVTATFVNGCKSFDTIAIINVWPLPLVKLDKNPGLCMKTVRQLDAGIFSTYKWHDGSILQYFNATGIGKYYVKVTDNNTCKGTDTTIISSILPLPSNFLPADTAVCNYGQISLFANQPYTSYFWANGSIAPVITVSKPGLYWLTVIDKSNCKATDTINVLPKQCLTGLYVPNAFTPNKDGKNDILKAFLFGNVAEFKFTIYNRYGEIIFTTSDSSKGWDGNIKGIAQNSGAFTWVCIYKLSNEQKQIKSGIVLLVR